MIIAYLRFFLISPGAPILDFMTSYDFRYSQLAEVPLCKTIEKPYDVMKSKRAALEKLKGKIGRNKILFCPTQKYYFQFSKIRN